MRFDTSEMGGNWTEVCAYGTAVFAIPLAEGEPGATGQSIYLTSAAAQQPTQQSTQTATSAAPQEHEIPPEI
jgi:hypothetical protein